MRALRLASVFEARGRCRGNPLNTAGQGWRHEEGSGVSRVECDPNRIGQDVMDWLRCMGWVGTGVLLLLIGAALPAHFRAVDVPVLTVAGEEGGAGAGAGAVLTAADGYLDQARHGVAGFLLEVARGEGLANLGPRLARWEAGRKQRPPAAPWGKGSEFVERYLAPRLSPEEVALKPVLPWVLRADIRESLRRGLAASTDPAATALLACRELESTRVLPAVRTAAGQPMDAGLMLAGALALSGRIHPGLALDLERAAVAARQDKGTERLENGLLDLLGVARHLEWDQLGLVTESVPSLPGLHALVTVAGGSGENWPLLVAGMVLGGGGGGVGDFIGRHGEPGLQDLRLAVGLGGGAVRELLARGVRVERVSVAGWLGRLEATRELELKLARLVLRSPRVSLIARQLLLLDGLFLVLLGLWNGRHALRHQTHRQFEPKPDLGVLAVVAITAGILLFLVSERYIFSKTNPSGNAGGVRVPALRIRLRADIPHVKSSAMNEKIIGMLVVFFAIQFAIYLVGLGRLRHIRGRPVEDGIKLRLLDNEESVFDAPLYLGIAGSVLALVLRLTGFDDVSLMASYSSTLFGILFCFLLKVIHVRPYRQQLILESASREQS